MMKFEICDMHGHFLPNMDDGSGSVKESLLMLKTAAEQGVSRMFATPHYYPIESVEEFLSRRAESAQRLQKAMAAHKDRYPQICLGAEVAYRRGLGNADGLENLCLGNSKYLLLELPFAPWQPSMFRDLSSLVNVRGLIPVIAHIERYMHMQTQANLNRLLQQDVLLQMNTSALLSWSSRGRARRLLKSGLIDLLGSDCHNMETRKPDLGLAVAGLTRRSMGNVCARLAELSTDIFREASENK